MERYQTLEKEQTEQKQEFISIPIDENNNIEHNTSIIYDNSGSAINIQTRTISTQTTPYMSLSKYIKNICYQLLEIFITFLIVGSVISVLSYDIYYLNELLEHRPIPKFSVILSMIALSFDLIYYVFIIYIVFM